MVNAELQWINDMEFNCFNRGLVSKIDTSTENGGHNLAPTPKELVLNAMMGCTAMDVVVVLKKMRQEINLFKMEIQAEKNKDYPVHFKSAVLIYKLEGKIEPEKAIKSVESSLTKYCGVNYMLSKTCFITYKLWLNGKLIKEGGVDFIDPKE